MKAIAIEGYGGPERLQLMDLPIPEVGPDDVLIRIRAAGVNPADISFREGHMAAVLSLTFPAIMGSDFAGTVAQVGGDVTTIRADAPVYGIASRRRTSSRRCPPRSTSCMRRRCRWRA